MSDYLAALPAAFIAASLIACAAVAVSALVGAIRGHLADRRDEHCGFDETLVRDLRAHTAAREARRAEWQ